MRRFAASAPFVVLPLALFAAFFDWAILDIGNAGWLIRGTDDGENALGLHAWLHDPAATLSLRTGLLNHPTGVPLLFTDSNPLVGLLAKPFAAILPADAQFVGPWYLLCLMLQVVFAWALLRRHAPGVVALWLGTALLAALPTLFARYVHANLFAHWLILASLWLYTDERRSAALRWWLPLIAAAALIHSYLLVMVGAIWASAMLEAFVRGDGRTRGAISAQAAAVLALVAALAVWLGVLGDFLPAHNYGAFAMPIDALVNPANSDYSTLLPVTAQREGRGFEGFQYLGAGLIALVVIAIVVLVTLPRPAREAALHRRLIWLVPALVVLTLLAISNYPDVAGQKLWRIPLPAAVTDRLDAVRASGRLFWPVAYTLVLTAIVTSFRLGRERATMLLAAAAAIQCIDLASMTTTIRAVTHEAQDRRLYARTPDARWAGLVAQAGDVTFVPADATRDLALFQEIAWRAVSAQVPVRTVYAARTTRGDLRRLALEDEQFRRGILSPRRLYVLLPGEPVPAAAAARMRTIDGVRVIVPSSPRSAS